MIPRPVLAHSWGWDEILYFAIPVMLALFWVRWVEQRARVRKQDGKPTRASGAGPGPPAGPPYP